MSADPTTHGTAIGASAVAPAEYLLRLADDRLVLGHRLSEWCGHAPILEEDIALANIALDLVGQATLLLELAAAREGRGRTADDLAYFRDARDFRNLQLAELPKGDFAFTIARQFLFDVYDVMVLEGLQGSADAELAGIAAKAYKEARYHLRHSGEWMLRLGDGTAESHRRAQDALDELWRFTGELFLPDELDARLAAEGLAPELATLRERWQEQVARVVTAATLRLPEDRSVARGGRRGLHTEHLGLMLAEMQSVARAHPGAQW
jgi:ring-1,2-phenylacetyl-CoA epoxidase subunit PaaC